MLLCSRSVKHPLSPLLLDMCLCNCMLYQNVQSAGVAGGAASGKTTVCDLIIEQLHDQRVVLVNQVFSCFILCLCSIYLQIIYNFFNFLFFNLKDSFYHNLTPEELTKVHEYNFDHPG